MTIFYVRRMMLVGSFYLSPASAMYVDRCMSIVATESNRPISDDVHHLEHCLCSTSNNHWLMEIRTNENRSWIKGTNLSRWKSSCSISYHCCRFSLCLPLSLSSTPISFLPLVWKKNKRFQRLLIPFISLIYFVFFTSYQSNHSHLNYLVHRCLLLVFDSHWILLFIRPCDSFICPQRANRQRESSSFALCLLSNSRALDIWRYFRSRKTNNRVKYIFTLFSP